jgi:hypothetical protein
MTRIKFTYILITIVALLGLVTSRLVAQTTITSRCGVILPDVTSETLWLATTASEIIKIDNESSLDSVITSLQLTTLQDDRQTMIVDRIILHSADLQATLVSPFPGQRRDDERTLQLLTLDGNVLQEIPSNTVSGIYWWALLPEIIPDSFYILGYDSNRTLYRVQISIINGTLQIQDYQSLPIIFNPVSATGTLLSASPDGNYIAYVNPISIGNVNYTIYSISQNEIVVALPMINFIPRIVWIQDGTTLAVVVANSHETSSRLITITQDGALTESLNATSVFNTSITLHDGVYVGNGKATFWAVNVETGESRLVLYSLTDNAFTDLCVVGQSTPIVPLDINGNIAFTLVNPFRVVTLSTVTGDYAVIPLSSFVEPIGVWHDEP